MGFTSPFATPQGSPSKKQLPPGANELSEAFENGLRLTPGSPTKNERQQLGPHSPNKQGRQDEQALDDLSRHEYSTSPPKPAKLANQENTPPNARYPKETNYTPTQAAISRREPYQARENFNAATTARSNVLRGLTPEEMEKLQLPKVKRLANVTQLCMLPLE